MTVRSNPVRWVWGKVRRRRIRRRLAASPPRVSGKMSPAVARELARTQSAAEYVAALNRYVIRGYQRIGGRWHVEAFTADGLEPLTMDGPKLVEIAANNGWEYGTDDD